MLDTIRSIKTTTWLEMGLFLALSIGWVVAYISMDPIDGIGTDYYPTYRAGKAILDGQDPYGPEIIEEFIATWKVPYPAVGYVYPLPLAFSMLPFSLLPLTGAIVAWILVGGLGSSAAIGLNPNWRQLVLLPLCFMPLFNAVLLKQVTLVWFAIAVLLLFSMQTERTWLVGICIALLPMKPQVGFCFMLAGVLWAWQCNRRALLWAAAWSLVLWGSCFLIQPTWVSDWLASVMRYNHIVYTAHLWPWGVLLLIVSWHLPWYTRLGVLHSLFIPIPDSYALLPLLLVWVAIGGRLAVVGSAFSWLGIVLGLPNTALVLIGTTIIPLILCSTWHWREQQRHKRERQDNDHAAHHHWFDRDAGAFWH